MKKFLTAFLLITTLLPLTATAKEKEQRIDKPFPILTTAYCQGEITFTGVPIREGICAVKEEWIGKTAIIYANNDGEIGEILGIFECLDTGFGADSDGDGIGSIQEGKVIDVYWSTYDRCVEWMKLTEGKCFVQLVDAEG